MNSKSRNRAILALIIANIIWGAASPIFKLALQNIPLFTLAYIRFWGATLIILPLAIGNLWIKKEDLTKLFIFSLSGITFNILFFFWGLENAPSINAPIIASAGPVFLYLYSILILKEKFNPKILVGTIVGLIGVLFVIGQPLIISGLNGQLVGNLFFLISSIAAVIHAIYGKKLGNKYHTVTLTFWSFLIGSVSFFPFFLRDLNLYHPFLTIDYRGWLGIIFGVFLSSALAYSLFEWGLKRMEEQEVGIFTYIDPITAILIAIPLLGEKLNPVFTIGTILIFLGIFIAEGRLHWHPLHKLKT